MHSCKALCTHARISGFCCSLTLPDAFEHSINYGSVHYVHLSEACSNDYLSFSSSVFDRLLVSCPIPTLQAIQLLYMISDVARLFHHACYV